MLYVFCERERELDRNTRMESKKDFYFLILVFVPPPLSPCFVRVRVYVAAFIKLSLSLVYFHRFCVSPSRARIYYHHRPSLDIHHRVRLRISQFESTFISFTYSRVCCVCSSTTTTHARSFRFCLRRIIIINPSLRLDFRSV